MTVSVPDLPWSQPGWFDAASTWIHAALSGERITVTGPIEQPHIRPWSTVLRVPTSEGALYFKATAPVLAHEAALTEALARWRPDCMPQVVATDLDRGWLLIRDAGDTLRSQIRSAQELTRWHPLLTTYANVQIELADRSDELLALGILDRRLAVLPQQYEQLVSDTQALRIDLPDGLTGAEYRRLRDLIPQFAALCERLAQYRIPETLHHDDFHDANVFVRGDRAVFADWGESCVAHPFFTLLVMLRGTAYRLKLEADAPELVRLRDIYLEQWTSFESRERLLEAFHIAQRVATVCRALTWHHVVSQLAEPLQAEYADTVPGWLQEFLNVAS